MFQAPLQGLYLGWRPVTHFVLEEETVGQLNL